MVFEPGVLSPILDMLRDPAGRGKIVVGMLREPGFKQGPLLFCPHLSPGAGVAEIPVVEAVLQGFKYLFRQLAQAVIVKRHTGNSVLPLYKGAALLSIAVKVRGNHQIILQQDDSIVFLSQIAAGENVPLEPQILRPVNHPFFAVGPGKRIRVLEDLLVVASVDADNQLHRFPGILPPGQGCQYPFQRFQTVIGHHHYGNISHAFPLLPRFSVPGHIHVPPAGS